MSSNISGTRLNGPSGFSLSGADEASASVKGEWNGLAVSVSDDPASLLADAAEELTFSASETAEKKVAERKKSEKDRPVVTIKPPEEVLEKMRQRSEEKMAKLLAAARGGNPAAFKNALDELFSEPSERHAALLWLEERLADSPSLADMARRERETLEEAEAAAIQAGYNIDGVDAEGMASRDDGKNLYRRTILGHGGIGEMLAEILRRGGDFLNSVEYLRRAVGVDLSASTPSTDKRELEAMNNDLYHLRAIGNFTREFDGEMAKIREKSGKPPLPRAGPDTLSLLCRMKDERLVLLDGLKSILALEGEKDATYDVLSLSQCRSLIHRLPAKLFADEDSRQRLLAAEQKMLDVAIDLEESLANEE